MIPVAIFLTFICTHETFASALYLRDTYSSNANGTGIANATLSGQMHATGGAIHLGGYTSSSAGGSLNGGSNGYGNLNSQSVGWGSGSGTQVSGSINTTSFSEGEGELHLEEPEGTEEPTEPPTEEPLFKEGDDEIVLDGENNSAAHSSSIVVGSASDADGATLSLDSSSNTNNNGYGSVDPPPPYSYGGASGGSSGSVSATGENASGDVILASNVNPGHAAGNLTQS